jgi:hypothetical protein
MKSLRELEAEARGRITRLLPRLHEERFKKADARQLDRAMALAWRAEKITEAEIRARIRAGRKL